MIRLQSLIKRYPGVARPAVDRLDLDIPTGETCVLIGPSGCGKTTTMRMINRLVEPTAGHIFVGDEDITTVDPVALRRRIGYVIQQVGLFPHLTIAANVATVPKLLGWNAGQIDARVDELLQLVGIDPTLYRHRFPRELSGGQRQRVGVARALAANPRVMLMDEPFGALDPITRTRLQQEFLRILRSLKKTVIMVTHDIDEAIKMGDRIAIMRDGALVQYGTPSDILLNPADDFVQSFVGEHRILKRLDLIEVRAAMTTLRETRPDIARIEAFQSLKTALAQILTGGGDTLAVTDEAGAVVGEVSLAAIREIAAGHTS